MYFLDVAVPISRDSERNVQNLAAVRPPAPGETGVIAVLPFAFDCIQAISSVRVKMPQDLRSNEARQAMGRTLEVRTELTGKN